MQKRIIVVFALFFSLGINEKALAQDPIFTQFYGNPLYLNPALAGAEHCPRVNLNYRNQWPGIDGTVYATYSASYDQHINKLLGGVGLLVLHDVAGPASLTTNNISGIYNYHLQVTHKFNLNFALQGTWFQKSIDWSKLTFGDMIDRRKGFVYNTLETKKLDQKQGWDFSAGVFGYTKNVYGGFAVNHLNQPDEGLLTTSKLPIKITAHFGAVIPLGDHRKTDALSISPNVLFQKQQDIQQLFMGVYVKKGVLVSGMWYRNRDAFIVLLGVQQPHFRIGYTYDVTVSKLTNATYGSHEISVALIFSCKDKPKKYSPVSCPSF
jgi:type IX secretion system PorP/SprF family membrane protein